MSPPGQGNCSCMQPHSTHNFELLQPNVDAVVVVQGERSAVVAQKHLAPHLRKRAGSGRTLGCENSDAATRGLRAANHRHPAAEDAGLPCLLN